MIIALLAVLLLPFAPASSAFPLRTLEVGGYVPDYVLPSVSGGEMHVLGPKGNITVLVFWSTDTEAKQTRAFDLLRTLQLIEDRYAGQKVTVCSVNFDKGKREYLKDLLEARGVTVPVLLDEREVVYGAYGLFVFPTAAIVDRDGTLKLAVGYTHDIHLRILGTLDVLLGLRTDEQLEKDLHPEEIVELPENVRKSVMHLNLGRSFVQKSMPEAAVQEFERATELDPQNSEARSELGTFYAREGNLEKAAAELSQAVALKPDSAQAHFGLGMLCRKKGEFDKAISEFERVLSLEPAHAEALRELGIVYESMGSMDKALEYYRKSLGVIFGESERERATLIESTN